jgi:hypothetical protein
LSILKKQADFSPGSDTVTARLPQLFFLLSAMLLNLLLVSAAPAAQPAATDEASSLVITYHVAPLNRSALRRELEKAGLDQFQRWKNDGILKNYRLLFSRYADADNWDAMALLTFASAAELARWKEVEQSAPGGLPPKALALVSAIHSAPVTLARSKSVAGTPTKPVFLVIPYVTLVSVGDYLTYADGYVIPQFDGWIDEAVLAQYELFLSSFPAGRPWSAMVILEYKDEAALARRNAVVAKVRARLKEIPEWKAISDNKKSVRDEKQVVIADQISFQ